MFAILCRRSMRALKKECIFIFQQQFSTARNALSVRSCSSTVCANASQNKPFTVSSYLINSCGLSSDDAVSASKKVCFKSPENPDAVLKLLREYGFTDSHHIPKIVSKWPAVLTACPSKTLLPKLDFFLSIGVPLPVLAAKLSVYPFVFRRSLKNSIIPSFNDLKSLLGSDERVARIFSHSPRCFNASSNISMLRERGVPEPSIVYLVTYQPYVLVLAREKLSAYVDRAFSMGFDISRRAFINAVRVFCNLNESTLKRKIEVYRKCGWSESDVIAAFLKQPNCMGLSEKKITANMDFLVNALGCKPAAMAQNPWLLTYSLEKRIKPRSLVAGVLNDKGLKSMGNVSTLFALSEHEFLNQYIVKYEKVIPELLDIYRGKSSPSP